MKKRGYFWGIILLIVVGGVMAAGVQAGEPASFLAAGDAVASSGLPWWGWPLILFAVTFLLGAAAALAGLGGGVLFVPFVAGFFPFHLDFVRGTGLLVALAGALSSSPGLLRSGLADLRLALPTALIVSISSITGAIVGLRLPEAVVQTALGVTILVVAGFMLVFRKSDYPVITKPGYLAAALQFNGIYYEESLERDVTWRIHRASRGLLLFVIIGFMAGVFGLGAGWANVPVLNLVMGAPLKLAVGTSSFLISASGAPAAWVYIHQGAVLPLLAVPSVLGMMLGARVGARLLAKSQPDIVRRTVLLLLIIAGARSLLKGIGLWG